MTPAPRSLKSALRRRLEGERVDLVLEVDAGSRRILGALLALTYDPEPRIAWRAVEATGVVTARMCREDPEGVRDHLRRLLWLLSEESGGICWRAPETMAEVVHRSPEALRDWVPIITNLLVEMAEEDLEHFRPGILWAIGRLGHLARDAVGDLLPTVLEALEHEDPAVRGPAAWCLGSVGRGEELRSRPELRDDSGEFDLFDGGVLRRTTVAWTVTRLLSEGPAGRPPSPRET